MDFVMFMFLVVTIAMVLPGIVFVPIMHRFDHTWVVPLALLAWAISFYVLMQVYKDNIQPLLIERIVTEEVVCEPTKKYDFRWK